MGYGDSRNADHSIVRTGRDTVGVPVTWRVPVATGRLFLFLRSRHRCRGWFPTAPAVYYTKRSFAFPPGATAMIITISATYENGVLKPEQPLPLPEHAKLQITLQTSEDAVRRVRE